MPRSVLLPKNNSIVVPDNVSDEQAIADARRQNPSIFEPDAPPVKAAPTSRTFGEAAVDIGAGFTKGIGSLVQFPSQVAGLVSGDMEAGPVGRFGKSIEEYGQSLKSPYLRSQEEQQQKLTQEAYEKSGILGEAGQAIKGTITNPALLTSFLAEQIPNFIGSLGAGAVAKIGVKTVARLSTGIIEDVASASAKAGVGSALATNAVMQGTDVGADTYQSVYDRLKEVSPGMSDDERKEIALSKGRAAGASAAAISLGLTLIPGAKTIEGAFLGKAAGDIEKQAGKGLLRRTAEGFGGEALSEGIEEGPGGQLLTNVALQQVDPSQRLGQGVGAATGLGAITGGIFGGLAGAVSKDNLPPEVKPLDAQFQGIANSYQQQGMGATDAYHRAAIDIERNATEGADITVYNSLGRQFDASIIGKNDEGRTVIKVDGDDASKTFVLGNEYTVSNPTDVRYGVGLGKDETLIPASDLNDNQLQAKIDEYESRIEKHEVEYDNTGIETPEFIKDKRIYTALTAADKFREDNPEARKPVEKAEEEPKKSKAQKPVVAQTITPVEAKVEEPVVDKLVEPVEESIVYDEDAIDAEAEAQEAEQKSADTAAIAAEETATAAEDTATAEAKPGKTAQAEEKVVDKESVYTVRSKSQERIGKMREKEEKKLYERALPRIAKLVSERLSKLGLGKVTQDLQAKLESVSGYEVNGSYLEELLKLAIAGKSDKQLMSTLNHESIHAMVELGMIAPEEWVNLKKLVDKKGWLKGFEDGELKGFLIDERYKTLSPSKEQLAKSKLTREEWIKEAKYEEAIADAFATYVTGRSPVLGYTEQNTPVYFYKKDLNLAGQPVGIINRILRILRVVKDVAAEDSVFKLLETPIAPKETEAKGSAPKLSVSKADLGREKASPKFSVASKLSQKETTKPIWYSELSRQIDKLPQKEMTAAQWKALLINPEETKSRGVRGPDNKVIPGEFITSKIPATSKLPGVKMKEIEDTEILDWLDVAGTSFEVDDYVDVLNDKYGTKDVIESPYGFTRITSAWEESDLTADELRTLKSAQSGGRKNTKISKDEVQQFLADGGSKLEFQDRVLGKTPLITKDSSIEKERDAGIALFEKIRGEDGGSIDVVGRKEKVFDDELYVFLEDGKITPEQLPAKYRPLAKAWLAAKKENAEFVEPKEEPTQFNAYQLPGGKNYREAFVTVPHRISKMSYSEWVAAGMIGKFSTKGIVRDGGRWVDGHGAYSGIDNPVVRIRFNDRTDVDGNKVLFLEELQPPNNPEFGKMPKTLQDRWLAIGLKRMIRYAADNGYDKVAWTTGEQQVERYESTLRTKVDSIEWEKTPEGVHIKGYKGSEFGNFMPEDVFDNVNAALRRNDQLGFDTLSEARRGLLGDGLGTAWLDRWDMRSAPAEDIAAMQDYIDEKLKKTKELVADTRYAENDLTEAIGKVMADRIRNDPAQTGVIEGDNLTIDSVGVKKLYDVGVPAQANKILKEMGGGKVGETRISLSHDASNNLQLEWNDGAARSILRSGGEIYIFDQAAHDETLIKTEADLDRELNATGEPAGYILGDKQGTLKQPSFDITPALSERAMQGMPRFSVAPRITKNIVQNAKGLYIYKGKLPESFYKWFGKSAVTDDDGYPLVMFHGTARDITEFKPKQANAIFITTDTKTAFNFSELSRAWVMEHLDDFITPERQKEIRVEARRVADSSKEKNKQIAFIDELDRLTNNELESENNLMPLFVRAENPFDYEDKKHIDAIRKELERDSDFSKAETNLILDTVQRGFWRSIEREEVQNAIRAAGFDGFFAKEEGQKNLAVYDPNQVKSVTGNSGEYSRESKDIRRSVAPRLSSNEREQSTAKPSVKPNRNPENQKFLPGEISLRDPIGQFLVITGSDIRAVPDHLASVVRSISQYNAFPTSTDPETMLRNMHETIVGNLIWLYDLIPENIRARAKLWYDGANRIANQMSDKYGYAPEQTAGVYAVLSPQKDWFMNVSLGDRVIAIFKERQNEMVSLPMKAWVDSYIKGSKTKADRIKRQEYAAKVRMLGNKRLKDMSNKEAALFIRTFDETYNPRQYRIITPEGGFLGFVTNNERDESDVESDIVEEGHVAWGSLNTIQKSVSILRDGSKRNISDQLGDMHKVRNFYNNILVPGSRAGHVTIDTHAVAAAFFKALSGASEEVSNNFGTAVSKNLVPEGRERFGPGGSNITGASGTYGFIADAYRDAASRVAKRDNIDLLPREMQSITWEAIRAIFPAAWKRENASRVEDIYNRAKSGEITLEAARDEVKALASTKSGNKLINDFAWQQATEGKFVKDGGTSFDQDIDPIAAKRKARLIEPYIIRDKFKVNLSAATTSEQLPGVAALYADAKAGSVAARRLLQEYAQDNLNHLLSGIEGIKISFNGAIGLYNKDTEPALSMSVSFPEEQRDKALAALNKFSTNFNQERFDVREKTNKDVGHVFDDGSYATQAVYFKIKSALNDNQVQELIDGSGLAGLTFGKDFVEAYYVAENLEKAADENEYKRFKQSIGRLAELLGENAGRVDTQIQRIWPYGNIGRGYGVTAESRNLGSYVPESSQVNNKTIKRVADYLNNKYRLTLTEEQQKKVPKTLRIFDPEKELTPKQDALQSMIARFMDLLPNNNLKNKLVVQGYTNLSQALLEQYKAMPIKVEINAEIQDGKLVVLPDKYGNISSKMRKDIQDNNHLYIYPTTKETFGPEGEDFSKHPLFAQSGLKDVNGYPLRYNDLLRAVHDYYAHGISEGAFGPLGEEAAWKTHMAMTHDPLARWALTMETRGQNSWVNFRENLDRTTPPKDRQFSPQKAAFLPIEFALTGTPAIDASMKQYIATLTPEERLGSPVKDKASFNRLLQEHRKNKTDGAYPKYSIAAQQVTSEKYSHAIVYEGTNRVNFPVVPETKFYLDNPERDELAYYGDRPVYLLVGEKPKFGIEHILQNALKDAGRRWESITDSDEENAVLGIIKILDAKDLKAYREVGNKTILRSALAKRAIVLGERGNGYSIISVVPSEMSKFGKPVDERPVVSLTDKYAGQMAGRYPGLKIKYRFKPEGSQTAVTVKKTRTFELPPKASVAPKLTVSPYIGATGSFGGSQIPTSFAAPAASKLTDHIYTWADKFVDLKNLQVEIEKTIGQLDDQYNAYQKEELYHRKVARQNLDFMRQEVAPLYNAMKEENITPEQLNDYLHNRHAEERNDQIDKINQGVVQGIVGKGSGIETQKARNYLNNLSAQEKTSLDRVAKLIDGIMQKTRDLMVSSGLEEQGTIDAWKKTYPNYVPLERVMGDPDEENTVFKGQGQGYSVSKSVKRAMGSTLDVEHIIANVLATRERTIVRAEKNEIDKALYGLAIKAPNPNVWIAVDPELPKSKNKNLVSLLATYAGLTRQEAQNIAAYPETRSIDRTTGLVTKGRNPQLAKGDNVLHLMIKGKEKLIFFNPRNQQANRLVRTLKNLDTANLARGLQTVGAITRYFAAVNTQYNPIFGVVNLTRDVQTALINLESTPIAGMQKQVISDFMPAIKGIWSQLRAEAKGGNGTGPWAALFKEFEQVGGPTGYRDMFANADDRAKMIESEIKALSQGKTKAAISGLKSMLSDYNTAFENGVRLAAYKAAIDKGFSKEKAASIAKNLTVNFNRKGDIALQAGALYAFFNASVQGTSRILQTMTKIENGKLVITPLGKKIIRGGLLLGMTQAMLLAAAGFDDENPPQFVREKNLIIPLMNGKYLTIPMPLGFNLLPNLSRNVTEWAMSGFKNTPKRTLSLLESVLTGLNPFGGGFSVQTLVPTVIDPVIALYGNTDSFGRRIAKEDFSSLRPTPGYTRTKDTATPWSKGLSEFLNYSSGGTQYMKGAFSPTPDQIDYLIGQATGGVGRELGKFTQTISSTVTGEELPSTKIPLASRFYGDTEESSSQSNKYYTNLSRINAYASEIKGRREHPGTGTIAEFIKDVPEARLVPLASSTYSAIQQIEKIKKKAIERGLPTERIRQLEKLAQERMKQFNKRVDSFQG